MNSYLLVYDRRSGHLDSQEYGGPDGRAEALRQRILLERQHRRGDIEVVVIAADSMDELRRTHSRYFSSVSSLTREAEGRLALA